MKSEAEIRINYVRAMGQADELERLARRVVGIGSDGLPDTLSGLHTIWEGENSKSYAAKGEVLAAKIHDNGKNLLQVAGAIRTVAGAVYRAEMHALDVAADRSYSR